MSRRMPHVPLLVIAAFWAFLPVLVGLIGSETAARTAPAAASQPVRPEQTDAQWPLWGPEASGMGEAPAALPEPATLVLLGSGVIAVVAVRRGK
jgi:hypothetical protein